MSRDALRSARVEVSDPLAAIVDEKDVIEALLYGGRRVRRSSEQERPRLKDVRILVIRHLGLFENSDDAKDDEQPRPCPDYCSAFRARTPERPALFAASIVVSTTLSRCRTFWP